MSRLLKSCAIPPASTRGSRLRALPQDSSSRLRSVISRNTPTKCVCSPPVFAERDLQRELMSVAMLSGEGKRLPRNIPLPRLEVPADRRCVRRANVLRHEHGQIGTRQPSWAYPNILAAAARKQDRTGCIDGDDAVRRFRRARGNSLPARQALLRLRSMVHQSGNRSALSWPAGVIARAWFVEELHDAENLPAADDREPEGREDRVPPPDADGESCYREPDR